MLDISKLTERIAETVESHKLDEHGAYCRWLWQDENNTRKMGINEYGCADALNIMYTIGKMPIESERAEYTKTLQNLQHPESGLFIEETHTPIHTTAHCIAALELLDAKPVYPLTELHQYLEKENLYSLLENLDWDNSPWPESHKGAGIYASLVLAEEADEQWQKWYFDWMWENADEKTGLWKKGRIIPHKWGKWVSIFPNLAATFHYLFNHEYAKMPLKYPEKLIDTCLEIFYSKSWPKLGLQVNFSEVDWVYCLNRSLRQCNHRFEESKKALKDFADIYIAYLNSIDCKTDDDFNDLHILFGMTCALAELQQALPGYIKTKRPLRLVLDRRPFI